MKELWEGIKAYVAEHPLPLLGVVLGIALAVLLLAAGFWRTLLIALLAAAGYGIGRLKEQDRSIVDFLYGLYSRIFKKKQ